MADAEAVRYRDPYSFQKAEDFFADFDGKGAPWVKHPETIEYREQDNYTNGKLLDVCYRGRVFRFDTGGLLLIQFLRPRVWRLRFNESHLSSSDFTDFNTQTVVQDTGIRLVDALDHAEELEWDVEIEDDPKSDHIIMYTSIKEQSHTSHGGYKRIPQVKLFIQRDPFRITATRYVGASPAFFALPTLGHAINSHQTEDEDVEAVIWRTKERGFQYGKGAVVLTVERTPTARYVGFGEQGGANFVKDKTFANYFNFDNMRYFNVYNKGPKCDAEPLYHSECFFAEANSNPALQSQMGSFVDNYSQICLDIGRLDWLNVRLATRFNAFSALFFAGDNIQDVITLFTSIIGRPYLKPRWVLGYHQGGYGYDTREKVERIVQKYRDYKYPLDGMHIDVDMQDNYRTFTINLNTFPDPKAMFKGLHDKGVKCTTNITPVIAATPCDWYKTLNEGLEKGYFIMDDRDLDPSATQADQIRYVQYGKGTRYLTSPTNLDQRPTYSSGRDEYDFKDHFNKKTVPFRGGVDYGPGLGAPGHYPNLNNAEVRKWWGEQYTNLYETGLSAVWQDMTSPCISQCFGDMKSLPFRLLLDADGWSGDPSLQEKKKAIEIWSLYSYNLHRATYEGLNRLKCRDGKRNFIIGRGSFAGANRYAGLWLGDNSSTWEFFSISVAQVLSLGLSGTTISGADVGGFEPPEEGGQWCDPELFIRWNIAYSLLPWYRNHYVLKGKKLFQEPWSYEEFAHSDQWSKLNMPPGDWGLYKSVHPIVRYYIRLRYSLMQLLYDQMFENMLHGLPIARAMIVTDSSDGSLYAANEPYTRSQYMIGNDLLHAPVMEAHPRRDRRKVYLPAPQSWFQFNLHAFDEEDLGHALEERVAGGKHVHYTASISAAWHQEDARLVEEALPYVTPMYVREGSILPRIPILDFIPDRHDPAQADIKTPITLHVYPGRVQTQREKTSNPYRYDMYLDDGVSRDSAPEDAYLNGEDEIGHTNPGRRHRIRGEFGDSAARSQFTHVKVMQRIERVGRQAHLTKFERQVTISSTWDHYQNKARDYGDSFTVVFWHEPETRLDMARLADVENAVPRERPTYDAKANATVVKVPMAGNGKDKGLTITVAYSREE